MLFISFVTFITTLQMYDLTLFDMGFVNRQLRGGGGGGGAHHSFVVIALMIMKFGTDVRLDVF